MESMLSSSSSTAMKTVTPTQTVPVWKTPSLLAVCLTHICDNIDRFDSLDALPEELSLHILRTMASAAPLTVKILSRFKRSNFREVSIPVSWGFLGESSLDQLLQHNLTSLDVSKCISFGNLEMKQLRALQSTLVSLDLSDCGRITNVGFSVLKKMSNLTSLNLSQTRYSDATTAFLIELKKLRTLNLSVTAVTDDGIEVMATTISWIENLDISETRVTKNSFYYLKAFKNLVSLDISKTKLTDVQLHSLIGLTNLQYLNLYKTGLNDCFFRKLSRIPNLFSQLRFLNIAATNITPPALAPLSRFVSLEKLALPFSSDDTTITFISNLTNLTHLSLNGTRITNKGLAQLTVLKKLNILSLCKTTITHNSLMDLISIMKLMMVNVCETQTNTIISFPFREHLETNLEHNKQSRDEGHEIFTPSQRKKILTSPIEILESDADDQRQKKRTLSYRIIESIMAALSDGIELLGGFDKENYTEALRWIFKIQDVLQWERIDYSLTMLAKLLEKNSHLSVTNRLISFLRGASIQIPLVRLWILKNLTKFVTKTLWSTLTIVRTTTEELLKDVCDSLIEEKHNLMSAEEAKDLLLMRHTAGIPTTVMNSSTAYIFSVLLFLMSDARSYSVAKTNNILGYHQFSVDQHLWRLTSYFRLLKYSARTGAHRNLFYHTFKDFFELFTRIDSYRFEVDENKKEALAFWNAMTNGLPEDQQLSNHIASFNLKMSRRLLDFFISIRREERWIAYNGSSLPDFYQIIHTYASSPSNKNVLLSELLFHKNWSWAIRFMYLESNEYPAVQKPIYRLLQLCCDSSAEFRKNHISDVLNRLETKMDTQVATLRFLELLVKSADDVRLFFKSNGLNILYSNLVQATEEAILCIDAIFLRVATWFCDLLADPNDGDEELVSEAKRWDWLNLRLSVSLHPEGKDVPKLMSVLDGITKRLA